MKTKLLNRYDMDTHRDAWGTIVLAVDASDGEYMLSEDVLNHVATYTAKITTLETQLKEAKAEAAAFVPAGAAINGVILYQRKGKA